MVNDQMLSQRAAFLADRHNSSRSGQHRGPLGSGNIHWAPADEKREDGLLGVFTFQGILAVTVALLYVLASPGGANGRGFFCTARKKAEESFVDSEHF